MSNLPKEYLSHSQYYLYKKDPQEYYLKYYIGDTQEATEPMEFGKIFQQAWADPKFEYKAALIEKGFTSNYERILTTALADKYIVRLPTGLTEQEIHIKPSDDRAKRLKLSYPIMGLLDGYEKPLVVENKMGRVWTREECETSTQLMWYSILVYVKEGYIPQMLLQSFNSKNGSLKHHRLKFTIKELKDFVGEINKVVADIKSNKF